MKQAALLFFFFLFPEIYAQTDLLYLKDIDQAPVLKDCPSYVRHDKQCFLNTLNGYVAKRIVLPFDENNNPIEGKVKVYLIFDKSGKLIVKAVRTSNKTLKESASTVFEDFTGFKPAVKEGKSVSMMMVYPVNYTFSGDPDTFFSIDEVTPPQLKNYKDKKTIEELRELYRYHIFSGFIKSTKLKGHLIDDNSRLYKYSFEIDSTGKIYNFKDLLKPGSDGEKYLNRKIAKKKGFLIPPKIGNIPVKIRDTVKMLKKGNAVRRTDGREREVIIEK
ncbi:MAG: hypothetical protein DSY82_04360 [Flavobacteriia bacterium]|nr:MAG: hypothetical protein DSY82_04360 [Flavobacteriia bacterium]